MAGEQPVEVAKQAVLKSPHLYHQHAETMLQSLSSRVGGFTVEQSSQLVQELLDAEYPHHKLLMFYALSLLLVGNCSNYRTNKLANLLNVVYASEMKKLNIADFNSVLTGYFLTVVHGATARASRQFLPETFKFVLELLRLVQDKPIAKYESVEFDDAVQKALVEEVREEWVLLKATLKMLQGLLEANSRYYKTEVVTVDINGRLEALARKIPNEPLLGILLKQISGSCGMNDAIGPYEPDLLDYQQLTPKFTVRAKKEQTVKDLKKKRSKMQKRIANELRSKIHDRLQQQQIRDETRHERIQKRHRKELFIVEKQTADARKIHRKIKRAKQASKQSTGKKK